MRDLTRVTQKALSAIAAMCISLGGFSIAQAASPEQSDVATPIVSEAWSEDASRNYAINLAQPSDADTLKQAETLVAQVAQNEGKPAKVLKAYASFGSFFVQAESKSFAKDYAQTAAQQGIKLHSVGDTRQVPVRDDENLVGGKSTTPKAHETPGSGGGISGRDGAWGMKVIGADKAKETIAKDVKLSPVTVGVLDSGIVENHEDFAGQIDTAASTSCITNGIPDSDPDKRNQLKYDIKDYMYHATHVAGIIAGKNLKKSGLGFTYESSVDPQAKLANIRVVYHNEIYPEYVVCGLDWSADHDIPIVNASFSVTPWAYWMPDEPSQAAGYEVVRRAAEYAQRRNVLIIVSAMNDNTDLDNVTEDSYSPSDTGNPIPNRPVKGGKSLMGGLPGVITVSNVQQNADGTLVRCDNPNYGSNYGKKAITIAAPGTYIESAYPLFGQAGTMAGTAYATGTSMAAPHVAGVAALIKGIHPEYTADQIREQLLAQADMSKLQAPTDGKEYRGAGLVDAYAAVTRNQPKAVIDAVEYSADGGATWHGLSGASVRGKVRIRAVMSGAVTSGTLSGAVSASGKGNGSLTIQHDVDFSELTTSTKQHVAVTALGRNNNPDADDDATASVTFTAEPTGDSGQPTPNKPDDGKRPNANEQTGDASAQQPKPELSKTGADVSVMIAVSVMLAVVAAGAMHVRRMKADR
ncbi:Subtilase family [Bifidobacterium leontopitheci]|uniref:Subtilase family n=1 Tax=Bifidobacterium leontopitheci TaxID=2650774 RepID=A0A6I1GE55_9BIFI|nr:Subtilase family [Bifidobacterium leontopitheci]